MYTHVILFKTHDENIWQPKPQVFDGFPAENHHLVIFVDVATQQDPYLSPRTLPHVISVATKLPRAKLNCPFGKDQIDPRLPRTCEENHQKSWKNPQARSLAQSAWKP